MKTKIFRCVGTQSRLEIGPFHEFLDDFIDEMKGVGYLEPYLLEVFRVLIHFSDWTGLNRIPLKKLTEKKLEEFWAYHCGVFQGHKDFRLSAHFFQFLRKRGVIPQKPRTVSTSPLEKILLEFENYLRQERGLSEPYIYQQVRSARLFIKEAFPETGFRWDRVDAQMLGDYMTRLLRKNGASETKSAASYLSQFFKYLFLKGKTKTNLSLAIPRPAHWRHTRLPIYIGQDKVKKMLQSCDRTTKIGARDYAVLLLLSRLGIRACEVRNLRLDDLHWREGTITVRGKGQLSKMPLPQEVGQAMSDYIKRFRGKSTSRSLFVSLAPPYHGYARSSSISAIVKCALKRAKIESKHQGTYLLRHTVANECMKNGSSLREVGQILRHKSHATTTIYAKVDSNRLSIVSRPWITGGVQ